MSRWLVGSSRIRRCGPAEGREAHQQPRLLAARELLDPRFGLVARKAHLRGAGADLRLGRAGISAATWLRGRARLG